MIDVIQSDTFKNWLSGLKDQRARARIQMRLDRLSLGNPGDVKPVREGISEMRIDYGTGYRVYFIRRGPVVVVLLSGGDKHTQDADIERAIAIAKEWSD
jgi:putative addiction module killer protein